MDGCLVWLGPRGVIGGVSRSGIASVSSVCVFISVSASAFCIFACRDVCVFGVIPLGVPRGDGHHQRRARFLAPSQQRKLYLRSPEYRQEKRTQEFKDSLANYKSEKCASLRADYSSSEREEMALNSLLEKSSEYKRYAIEKGLVEKSQKDRDENVLIF